MQRVKDEYNEMVMAILCRIQNELSRCQWNKYQEDVGSPFLNTGKTYSNPTFSVRAYYWGSNEEEEQKPNFEWKDVNIFWYKHATRDVSAYIDSETELSDEEVLLHLNEMLNECMQSIKLDFGEDY